MSTIKEELAVIKGVRFGMQDEPWPCLVIGVELLIGGAGITLHYEDAAKLIRKHHIGNIQDLDGMPCIVEITGRTVKFKELKK